MAATCTNAFIPDNLNKIFISPINPTAEPSSWTEFANFGTNTPGKMLGETGGGRGFQNCPKFCENMDKSLCTGCFTIPNNFPTGRYVFQWRWVFNSGETAYTYVSNFCFNKIFTQFLLGCHHCNKWNCSNANSTHQPQ